MLRTESEKRGGQGKLFDHFSQPHNIISYLELGDILKIVHK